MAKPDRTRQGELTVPQERAIEILLAGGTDSEAAQAAEVTRQTVNGWKRQDALFVATMNARRAELWDASSDKLRALIRAAIEEFGKALEHEDARIRLTAASKVLQAASVLTPKRPAGPVTPFEAALSLDFP